MDKKELKKRGRPRKEEPKMQLKRGRPRKGEGIVKELVIDNGIEKAMPAWHGRKYLFKTPQQLERRIDEYFKSAPIKVIKTNGIETERRIYTKRGLLLSVGMHEEEFDQYFKVDGFRQVLSRAMLVVGDCYEQLLHTDKPSGAIFALKNMGWSDTKKDEVKVTVNPFIQILQKRARIQEGIEDAQIVEMKELPEYNEEEDEGEE